MKKRYFLYLIPLLFFSLTAVLLYNNEMKRVHSIVNNDFLREAPTWPDSVMYLSREFMYRGKMDNEFIKNKMVRNRPIKVLTEYDTIYIGKQYVNTDNILRYMHDVDCTVFMMSDNHNLYKHIIPSWSESLRRAGIEAEVSVVLCSRKLKELFPKKDSININAPIYPDTLRMIDFERAYRTDSLHMGFSNQFSLVGYAIVTPNCVFKRLSVPYTIIAGFLLFYLLSLLIVWLHRFIVYKRRYVRFVGDAILHLYDNEIVYKDGSRKKLGVNEYATLCKLIGCSTLALNNLQSELWPMSDTMSRSRSFNVSFSKLNSALKDVKRVTLSRDDEYLYLTDTTTLRELLSHYWEFVRLYIRKEI